MSELNPPLFLQAGAHPAANWRRYHSAMLGRRGGVALSTDLVVTQRAAGVNMSVDVATGSVYVPGTQQTYQGMYFCENQGARNVTLATSDGTNPRNDLIIARVYDSTVAGGDDEWTLEVVTGTPAASPSDPGVPVDSWVLARVVVPAAASSISDGDITDLRSNFSANSQAGLAAGLGGVITCTSASRPPHHPGRIIYETNTSLLLISNGSAWALLNGALGVLGYAQITSSSASFTTLTDIAGLSVTVTVLASRRIKVTCFTGRITNDSSTDQSAWIYIREGSTTLASGIVQERLATGSGGGGALTVTAILTPSAGAHTYKLSCIRDHGSDSHYLAASTTMPSFILVEDIGAA